MIARRRMAGRRVARAAVGTAVVAGTAGAVRHHQEQRYARQDAEQQAEYEAQQEQYAPQQAAPETDMAAQLQQLADLHASGVLSDEEFASAKAKILNG